MTQGGSITVAELLDILRAAGSFELPPWVAPMVPKTARLGIPQVRAVAAALIAACDAAEGKDDGA